MLRGDLLRTLRGFDAQFFYHYEEVDLCRRVWNAGFPILFTPEAVITHLGGQSVNRFPIHFEIEKHRSRYRYFYKHFGPTAANACRRLSIAKLRVRQIGYSIVSLFKPSDALRTRLEMYQIVLRWNKALDPLGFVERGEEPALDQLAVPQPSL